MKKAGWGWCTPLIPGIRREKQADLLSLREARPADSKFLQDRTGYTENHVSKGKERKRKEKEKSKINNNKIIIKEKISWAVVVHALNLSTRRQRQTDFCEFKIGLQIKFLKFYYRRLLSKYTCCQP